jgi:hypothetical protein
MKLDTFDLTTLAGGEAMEALRMAFEQLWEDVVDLNKEATAPRKATLTIVVTPQSEEKRMRPIVEVSTKAQLAPWRTITDTAYLEMTGDGIKAVAVDPEQIPIDFEGPKAVEGGEG